MALSHHEWLAGVYHGSYGVQDQGTTNNGESTRRYIKVSTQVYANLTPLI
jgi:hypothetical protein